MPPKQRGQLCSACKDLFSSPFFLNDLLTEEGVLFERSLQSFISSLTSCDACRLVKDSLDDQAITVDDVDLLSVRFTAYKYRGKPGRLILCAEKQLAGFTEYYMLAEREGTPTALHVYGTYSSSGNCDPAMFDLAREWLADCDQNHAICKRSRAGFMPSRCLYLPREKAAKGLKLVECRGLSQPYAALSYCWGGEQSQKLKLGNVDAYKASIDAADLPIAIQNALRVTREMGLQYLWVDAYCIIQDSEEDLVKELDMIRPIFKYSYLTISAAQSQSAYEAFLRQELPRECIPLPIMLPTGERGNLFIRRYESHTRNEEPVSLRGWTLEERLLPARILEYPTAVEVSWQCGVHQSTNIDSPEGLEWYEPDLQLPVELFQPHCVASRDELQYIWATFLSDFMLRSLYVSDDRFHAAAGIAEELNEHMKDKYYAGIWKHEMLQQLLWINRGGRLSDFCKPALQYRAPSWSWASVDGEITARQYPNLTTSNCEVVKCTTTLKHPSLKYGPVKNAELTVTGPLKRAILKRTENAKDPHACQWSVCKPGRFSTKHEVVGECAPDTKEATEFRQVWCLPVGKRGDDPESEDDLPEYMFKGRGTAWHEWGITGLLLAKGNDKTYRRLGIFVLNDTGEHWISGARCRTINIV